MPTTPTPQVLKHFVSLMVPEDQSDLVLPQPIISPHASFLTTVTGPVRERIFALLDKGSRIALQTVSCHSDPWLHNVLTIIGNMTGTTTLLRLESTCRI